MFLFIPLLLAVPTVIWWLKEKQRIELVCERQALASQEKLVDGMNALLSFNPLVETLVAQKKYLELAVKTAPHPAAKAMLMAQLAAVIIKIKALRSRQLMVIKTQEAQSYLHLTRMRAEIRWHVLKMHELLQTAVTPQVNVDFTRPKIHLQPLFIDRMIPIYKATPQLPNLQSIHILIRIKKFLVPGWLEFLKNPDQDKPWTESCSSTPHKGGMIWESLLGKARPF